jgi:hypothetical protein
MLDRQAHRANEDARIAVLSKSLSGLDFWSDAVDTCASRSEAGGCFRFLDKTDITGPDADAECCGKEETNDKG